MKVRSVVIFFVSLLVFGGAYFVIDQVLDLSNQTLFEINPEDLGEGNKIEEFGDDLLFLLVGVDKNPEGSGGQSEEDHVRTDTMILVNVNFESGDIKMLSIPRDTKIKYNGETVKINAAHSYDGIVGAMKAVRDLTGLDVDYYMSIDYDAVTRLVDTIGGVEVDSPVRLNPAGTPLDIPKGKSTLSGYEALYFVRAREMLPGGSDLSRMNNQQYFMGQLIDALIKPSNILKIGKIFDVYKENVKTNIPMTDFKISEITSIVSEFSKDKLESKTLPVVEDNSTGTSYVIPKKNEMYTLLAKWFPDYFIDKDMLDKYKNGKLEEESSEQNYNEESYDDSNNYNNNNNGNYNNNNSNYNSNNGYNKEYGY